MTDNASNMIAAFKMYDKKLEECVTEEDELQLVVKLFEKSPPIKDVMAKVRAIVNSFGHSHTTVAALMARTGGLKLISDNTTRWSSTLLMAERMVKIQAAVETIIVVEQLVKVPNLSQSEWLVLKGIVKFLGKFKLIKARMQAEKVSTIHKIIPHLKDILAHLSHMKTLAEPGLLWN
ncbi:hypothetical protein RvY_01947 [Ramazzottius varieornatus]|uniref:Uncharacterized protein n=1 Tax=Ramazzottius varieornatus TaxID=947166 RepID=A0A1D1UP23_RAMVA|nr:hypothetical protein RvY_01947 [Ramazzottius varieornatus]